jgi:ParB-like chromosome segregation protein Spo0J
MAMSTHIPAPDEATADRQPHEFCLALPEMPQDRFDELVEDIARNGLIRQIVIFEGKILDGRHRYRACIEAGVAPRFTPFRGTIDDAYNLVVAENLRRRDLTPEQRLDAATKLIAILREKSKAAARAGNALGGKGGGKLLASLPKTVDATAANVVPFEPKHTHVEVARAAGVSPRTAQDFITVKERGAPEDLQAVVTGNASVSRKAREVRERAKPKAAATKGSEEPTAPRPWKPTAEVRRVLEALSDEPQASRDLLRGMLDIESPYEIADLLIAVLAHRPYFAQDVANAVLDRLTWASRNEEDDAEVLASREATR